MFLVLVALDFFNFKRKGWIAIENFRLLNCVSVGGPHLRGGGQWRRVLKGEFTYQRTGAARERRGLGPHLTPPQQDSYSKRKKILTCKTPGREVSSFKEAHLFYFRR